MLFKSYNVPGPGFPATKSDACATQAIPAAGQPPGREFVFIYVGNRQVVRVVRFKVIPAGQKLFKVVRKLPVFVDIFIYDLITF